MKKIIFIFILSFACSENSDTLFSEIVKKKHLLRDHTNITKRYDYLVEEGKRKIEKIKEYIEDHGALKNLQAAIIDILDEI